MDHSVPRKVFDEAIEYEERVSLVDLEGVDALVRDMRLDEKLAWACNQRKIWRAKVLKHIKQRFGIDEEEYVRLCMEHEGKCAFCGRIPGGSFHVGDSSFLQPSYYKKGVLYCTGCRYALEKRGPLCQNP